MKIYLIGLSGSGKTTLGKQLAEKLDVPFVDMDWEIEKKENKSVQEIFSQNGEDYFRQLEATILREWASAPQDFVMGTGGGAPCFYDGINIINQSGISIFLDVPVDELQSRLANAIDRPLLNSGDESAKKMKLHSLRIARLPIYKKAHITIENATLDKLVDAIHLKR
ncbi:shikimate kinase [Chryseolinea sp. H1M3-3]|uniref:shikimate kinase n=1 Tax=Chryseolinea sp. H1M3-3 TaxID=3034144 RepID=UPI0023ECD0ED|nr:shikimate kinase [Chryseolinea sp. H1M3-3]